MPYLVNKTSVDALSEFLLDPLHVRPSGRMPEMQCDDIRSGRDSPVTFFVIKCPLQVKGPRRGSSPLAMTLIGRSSLTPLASSVPVETTIARSVSFKDLDHPDDRFAIRFNGMINVAEQWHVDI